MWTFFFGISGRAFFGGNPDCCECRIRWALNSTRRARSKQELKNQYEKEQDYYINK